MGHIFVTMAVTGNYKNIQYKNIKTDEENKFVRTRSEDANAVPVINNKAGPGTAETEQLSTTGTMMTMKCWWIWFVHDSLVPSRVLYFNCMIFHHFSFKYHIYLTTTAGFQSF